MFVFAAPMEGAERLLVSLVKPDGRFRTRLPTEAMVGHLIDGQELVPGNFAENPVFRVFLHAVIAGRGPECEGLQRAAAEQGDGTVLVLDKRCDPSAGDISREDLFGAFRAEGGAIVEDSYVPNDDHVLLSGKGFFRLDRCIYDRLMEELARLA